MAFSEKRLAELRPKVLSPELDTAKDTRTVMSDRVRLLHTHEARCAALEAKCVKATDAIRKHGEALERAVGEEKERHAKTMKQIQDDVARMIKNEEDTIKEATEDLRKQKQGFEEADESYNGFIAKQLPAEPATTAKHLKTEMITKHLLEDPKLAGIIDLQAEGVAQSLCALLNLIVDGKTAAKGTTDDGGESEMDLDETEIAAKRDHEKATEQMDGTQGKAAARRRARKKAQEQSGGSNMDTAPEIRNETGKRDAKATRTLGPKSNNYPQIPSISI